MAWGSSRFVKLLATGNLDSALLAIGRVTTIFWREITFTVRSPPGGGNIVWAHATTEENPVPPEQAWKFFPTVVDRTSEDTAADLAERVQSMLQLHGVPFVDLITPSFPTVVETLAALPPWLNAGSFIGPRPDKKRFCAQVAKNVPQLEPVETFPVSKTTDPLKLKAALVRAMEEAPVRVTAPDVATSVTALRAIEAVKWSRNREILFTVQMEPEDEDKMRPVHFVVSFA